MTSNCAWAIRHSWRLTDNVVVIRGSIGAKEQLHMVFRISRWVEGFKLGSRSAGVDQLSIGAAGGAVEKVPPAIKAWFDPVFYRAAYPDVVAAGLDPLFHYVTHGAAEMRDPNRWFSTIFYVQANPEVAVSGVNPLSHYVTTGHLEGRFPSALERQRIQSLGGLPPVLAAHVASALPVAQIEESKSSNVDDWAVAMVAEALDPDSYSAQLRERGIQAEDFARHYLLEGWAMGLDPSQEFSTRFYLATNPDVGQAAVNPFLHYLTEGRHEGRLGLPNINDIGSDDFNAERDLVATAFNTQFYISLYPDITEAGALDHFVLTGWREGRDPNPRFSTSDYLEMYPDIRASGINPFYHYLLTGRLEGRSPKQELGYRFDVLRKLQRIDRAVEDYRRHVAPVRLTASSRLDNLGKLLNRSMGTACYITVSHDDFTRNFGGVQLVIMREAEAVSAMGRDHVHLFPSAPLPVVEMENPEPKVGVLVNGKLLGHFRAVDIAAAFRGLKSSGLANCTFAVHSLLGHNVDGVIDVIQAAGGRGGWFWVHDYASICSGFTLLRNNVQFCDAPPITSTACMVCSYRPLRAEQVRSHARLFEALDMGVVAPSQSALDVWISASSFRVREARVHLHAALLQGEKSKRAPRKPGPLRVAFLGLPSIHKGWGAFRDLALSLEGDDRYEFHHLGKNPQAGLPIKFSEVIVKMTDLDCMVRTVRELDIDVALLWALWPETFCITAYEAVSGGAAILTYQESGNVAAMVRQTGAGEVLGTETELKAMFADGSVHRVAKRRPKSRLQLEFSHMTIDLVNESA